MGELSLRQKFREAKISAKKFRAAKIPCCKKSGGQIIRTATKTREKNPRDEKSDDKNSPVKSFSAKLPRIIRKTTEDKQASLNFKL